MFRYCYHSFPQQVGYRINLRTRECERFPLQEPFPYVEVPTNATLDYTFYLGSSAIPGNFVEMNYYSAYTERGKCHDNIQGSIIILYEFFLIGIQVTTGEYGLQKIVFHMYTLSSLLTRRHTTIVPRELFFAILSVFKSF